jgi:hypothetical protein
MRADVTRATEIVQIFNSQTAAAKRREVVSLSFSRTGLFKAYPWNVRLSVSFIAFLIAHSLVATFGSTSVLRDPDTLWHIRTGNWILENGTVPKIDIFSHTVYGQFWIANDWLADVIFALAFNFGGWRGVVELTALGVGIITAIICHYLTRILRFSAAIGLTAITVALISPHYLARPLMFSYSIMLIWVIILLERYERDNTPPILLVPLMALWANVHGGFTIGLVFLYVYAVYACYRHVVMHRFERLRQELFLVLVVTVGALITPYGIHSVLITPKALSMKFALDHITEWRSPDFKTTEVRYYLLYMIAIFSIVMAYGVRLRGPRLPIFMLMMYLGCSYLRGLIQFVLLVPIILARPVAARVWYLRAQSFSQTGAADPVLQFLCKHLVAVPAACFAVAVVTTVTAWSVTEPRPTGSTAPQAAIEYVKEAKIGGNVFNSYDFGGYLIFSGIPTAVDGRMQPFGDTFLRRYSNAIDVIDVTDAFQLLDEYHIGWAILQPNEALGKELGRSRAWKKVYTDEYAVVFVRL